MVDYSVSSDEFVIKVNYDEDQFELLIDQFLRDIIKKAQKSKLHRYGWAVLLPLVEEIVDAASYFLHSVVITITVN